MTAADHPSLFPDGDLPPPRRRRSKVEPVDATEADLEAWVESVEWVFARSVPNQPHQYTIRRDGDDGYDVMRAAILTRGERRLWPPEGSALHDKVKPRPYAYYVLGRWEYWATPNFMLNRRRCDWRDA